MTIAVSPHQLKLTPANGRSHSANNRTQINADDADKKDQRLSAFISVPFPQQARPGNGRTHSAPLIQARTIDHRRIPTSPQARLRNGRPHSAPIVQTRIIDHRHIPTSPQANPGNGRTHSAPLVQTRAINHRWENWRNQRHSSSSFALRRVHRTRYYAQRNYAREYEISLSCNLIRATCLMFP